MAGLLSGLDAVLDRARDADLGPNLRDRARTDLPPLRHWRQHLSARWPDHQPFLAGLGNLALDSIGSDELAAFADRLRRAQRVYWCNDPEVAASVDVPRPPADVPGLPVPPASRLAGPGCVLQRSPMELFSTIGSAGPVGRVALEVVASALQQRLMELEPLAKALQLSQVELAPLAGLLNIDRQPIGLDVVLLTAKAAVPADRQDECRAAVLETFERLADGALAPQYAPVRQELAAAERDRPADAAQTLRALAEQHLLTGGRPTPTSLAEDYERTTDEDILAALVQARCDLLLAVPTEVASSAPPVPLMERLDPRPTAGGAIYRYRYDGTHYIRCSPERIAHVVRRPRPFLLGWRESTGASVDFAEVVLRVDEADQSTRLLDAQQHQFRIVWGDYQHSGRLRRAVDRHTVGVPLVHQARDEYLDARAATVRRARRRVGQVVASFLVLVFLLIGGIRLLTRADPVTDRTINGAGQVTLSNGTTIAVIAGPEQIEHYSAVLDNVHAVEVRMCGGRLYQGRNGDHSERLTFYSDRFALLLRGGASKGDTWVQPWQGLIPERPPFEEAVLDPGRCEAGWLLFDASRAPSLTLDHHNATGDHVIWRLPPATTSPLTKPCPPDEQWLGCPAR